MAAFIVLLAALAACSGEAVTTSSPEQATTSVAPPTVESTAGVATSAPSEGTAAEQPPPVTTSQPITTTTTMPPRDCSPRAASGFRLPESGPGPASVELSRATYPCAEEIGLAPVADEAAAATVAAHGLEGPLLLVAEAFDRPLMTELRRLAPDRILAAGFTEGMLDDLDGFEVTVLEVDPDATLPHDPTGHDLLWLVAPDAPLPSLTVVADDLGIGVVAVEPDFRTLPEETRAIITSALAVELVSGVDEDSLWQLDVVRRGVELPGGGLVLFEDDIDRRLVALYGHPTTSVLGVLGEQDPEAGVERLKTVMAGYEEDGAIVLPTFEIIASVASAGAGSDGDYSAATRAEVIRPWIEAAAYNDVYVVLDLQPGRTDFLTQAKLYEEFLRLPHVGLALDPEWRLKPNQVHLRQIGTVDAAEVNEVVRWLAGIVRQDALPQKLLIVHQFRFSMITNRELIETPPELAVVIQMDGQGSLESKYTTWNAITRGMEGSGFRWGWKNFYDEDSPTATPDQVLALRPVPVFVSYQ